MHILITGYYQKLNLGDDLFENIAKKIIKDNKIKKDVLSFKIVPIEKINLCENRSPINRVILFGGETLNNYFLDKLIELWKFNNNIKFNGVGVSCNQDYNEILNKMHLFESVSFRSKKDYDYFKNYLQSYYYPDIVFTLKKNKKICLCNNNVGFFLSQTAIANLNNENEYKYISSIVNFIRYLISKNYKIYLFATCCNNKYSEDDNFINIKILENLSEHEKNYIKCYSDNKKILKNIYKMKYNICFRYHSHILSMIYNIPFISISNTPKVIDLLNESRLKDLNTDIDNLKKKFDEIVINKKNIKNNIKKIYEIFKKQTKIYYKPDLYFKNKKENTFYIEPCKYQLIYNDIVRNYNIAKTEDNKWFNSQIITYYFTRSLDNKYTYGLNEKIEKGIKNLKDDIYWLINDSILNNNIYFYENVSEVLNYKCVRKGNINMRYINQNDYKGLHRSGWQYVVENLDNYHSSNTDSLLCDLYLDRTFHWNYSEYNKLGIIPYKKNWIGFIHHTIDVEYTTYNTINLFKNKLFLASLMYCKGLFVLSNNLKNEVEKIIYKNNINVKVYSLTHPTEFVCNNYLFNMKKFNSNPEKKIIQIGAWMRVIEAINKLELGENKLKLQKYALCGKKMENYYYDEDVSDEFEELSDMLTCSISRDKDNRKTKLKDDVKKIVYLENNDYDNLLSENIVFINLIEASAVNTVIECIVRNTPIVVNKLPALVEVLGNKYPLFYDNLDDVKYLLTHKNIDCAYHYLKHLDKTKFKIDTFINEFNNIVENIMVD
jgi:polysaccharide pyruvyl transferase WcaK-like protein